MKQKVTVVGAGNVGATAAQRIVEKELADVALIDIIPGVPQGKSLDIMESAPVEKFDARMVGANDYDVAKGSDVVVITAGLVFAPWGGLKWAIYLLAVTAWFTVGQRVFSVRRQLRDQP